MRGVLPKKSPTAQIHEEMLTTSIADTSLKSKFLREKHKDRQEAFGSPPVEAEKAGRQATIEISIDTVELWCLFTVNP